MLFAGDWLFFFCLFFVFLSPFIPFIFYRDLTAKVSHKQRVYICILTRMLTTANAPPPPSLSNSSPLLPHYFFYLRSSKQLGNSKERPTTILNNNNNQRVVHLFCMYCQLIDYQLFYTIYCTHISFLWWIYLFIPSLVLLYICVIYVCWACRISKFGYALVCLCSCPVERYFTKCQLHIYIDIEYIYHARDFLFSLDVYYPFVKVKYKNELHRYTV